MSLNNDKALRYLGLAARAGKVIAGVEECCKAAEKKKKVLLIIAADAAKNARKRADEAVERYGIGLLSVRYDKQQLGESIGKVKGVALMMLTDENLAKAFMSAVKSDSEQEEQL